MEVESTPRLSKERLQELAGRYNERCGDFVKHSQFQHKKNFE